MTEDNGEHRSSKNPDRAPYLTLAAEKVTGLLDRLLGFFNAHPEAVEEKQPPGDWSEDMPATPNDAHVRLLLNDTLIVLTDTTPDTYGISVTCHPTSGYTPDGEIEGQPSFPLEVDLTDTPDIYADYLGLIEAWAMSETPVVVFATPTTPILIVNPNAPEEWVPVPNTEPMS